MLKGIPLPNDMREKLSIKISCYINYRLFILLTLNSYLLPLLMLISYSHKFIFFHVTKTAETSVKKALKDYVTEPDKFKII